MRQDGRVAGDMLRPQRKIYDPERYVPVLARKPSSLRTGAPFQDWALPAAPEPGAAQARWLQRWRPAKSQDPADQ